MVRQYFRVIQTFEQNPMESRRVHEIKLNNYCEYGWADEKLPTVVTPLSTPIKICSQSTATTVKNEGMVITTTLLCEEELARQYASS